MGYFFQAYQRTMRTTIIAATVLFVLFFYQSPCAVIDAEPIIAQDTSFIRPAPSPDTLPAKHDFYYVIIGLFQKLSNAKTYQLPVQDLGDPWIYSNERADRYYLGFEVETMEDARSLRDELRRSATGNFRDAWIFTSEGGPLTIVSRPTRIGGVYRKKPNSSTPADSAAALRASANPFLKKNRLVQTPDAYRFASDQSEAVLTHALTMTIPPPGRKCHRHVVSQYKARRKPKKTSSANLLRAIQEFEQVTKTFNGTFKDSLNAKKENADLALKLADLSNRLSTAKAQVSKIGFSFADYLYTYIASLNQALNASIHAKDLTLLNATHATELCNTVLPFVVEEDKLKRALLRNKNDRLLHWASLDASIEISPAKTTYVFANFTEAIVQVVVMKSGQGNFESGKYQVFYARAIDVDNPLMQHQELIWKRLGTPASTAEGIFQPATFYFRLKSLDEQETIVQDRLYDLTTCTVRQKGNLFKDDIYTLLIYR